MLLLICMFPLRFESMADPGHMNFCPRCETHLPARTFRRHRFLYFKHDSNSWERDPDLGSRSNDDSDEYMQIDNDSFSIPSSPLFHGHSNSEVGEDLGLLDQEIWDEVLPNEIDEDFNDNPTMPSVDTNQPHPRFYRTLLNCLLILAYFWTFSPDFLLLSLKRFGTHTPLLYCIFSCISRIVVPFSTRNWPFWG